MWPTPRTAGPPSPPPSRRGQRVEIGLLQLRLPITIQPVVVAVHGFPSLAVVLLLWLVLARQYQDISNRCWTIWSVHSVRVHTSQLCRSLLPLGDTSGLWLKNEGASQVREQGERVGRPTGDMAPSFCRPLPSAGQPPEAERGSSAV